MSRPTCVVCGVDRPGPIRLNPDDPTKGVHLTHVPNLGKITDRRVSGTR